MAASVLSSPRAVAMSILVVRAFVRLRDLLPPISLCNPSGRLSAISARYEGVLQMGVPPLRIDIIHRADGITLDEVEAGAGDPGGERADTRYSTFD